MAWTVLILAVVCEVAGTSSLRLAVDRGRAWYALTALLYIAAFTALSTTLHLGMPLGMAYGIWAALGVALTAVVSRVAFKEPLDAVMAAGIALIVGGVLLLETGS